MKTVSYLKNSSFIEKEKLNQFTLKIYKKGSIIRQKLKNFKDKRILYLH